MASMEPQDFGGLYHAFWEQASQGDFDTCRSILKVLQTLIESGQESDRFGAKATLDDLSERIHEHIQTQDLDVFENLERFEYEELLAMTDRVEESVE